MNVNVIRATILLILILFLSACGGEASEPTSTPIPLTDTPSPTATATPLPTEITDVKGVEMVLVPEGEFTMGGSGPYGFDTLVHQVFLDTYYIDKYEVTNALYRECVEADVCDQPEDTDHYKDSNYAQHPVVYVDWYDAKTYCEWRGTHLPTTAEWEKAARGTAGQIFPWEEEFDFDESFGNFGLVDDTTPVGNFPKGKSPYGAYDMAGNVWEWTSSLDKEYPYSSTDGREDLYSEDVRVIRGGDWFVPYPSALYTDAFPMEAQLNLGFRCSGSEIRTLQARQTAIALATETFTPTKKPTETATVTLTMTVTPSPAVLPSEFTDAKGVEMVLVPEGEFTMGSDSEVSRENEQPTHQVYLNAYYIDKYEVTNALYRDCVQEGACNMPSSIVNYFNSQYDQHPVVFVDWDDASAYCEWRDARLPTEAEWEKAARGTDGRTYPWGETINDTFANFGKDYNDDGTTAVGSYPKGVSPYGAYDMAGNVWEWVADWYDENYYENSSTSNPLGPASGESRAHRGGAWYNKDEHVRGALRSWANGSDDDYGFRCALSP